jgi:hypothetical protein
MEYKIVEARDKAENLEAEVNKHIQQGWQPTGGLSVAVSEASGKWWYYQAMMRD